MEGGLQLLIRYRAHPAARPPAASEAILTEILATHSAATLVFQKRLSSLHRHTERVVMPEQQAVSSMTLEEYLSHYADQQVSSAVYTAVQRHQRAGRSFGMQANKDLARAQVAKIQERAAQNCEKLRCASQRALATRLGAASITNSRSCAQGRRRLRQAGAAGPG